MSSNIGPLKTAFTPPSSCATATGVTRVYTRLPDAKLTHYYNFGGARDPGCFPSSYAFDYSHYYSPGVCPSGLTEACHSTNVVGSLTETVKTCCPTDQDYACQAPGKQNWESSLGCTLAFSASTTFPTITVINLDDVTSTLTRVSEGTDGGINAYGVVIKYQSSDFATTTAKSTSSSHTAPTALSSQATSTSSPNDTTLSQGAIAGIVIGAVLFVLACAVGAYLVWRQKGKKRQEEQTQQPQSGPVTWATYKSEGHQGQHGHAWNEQSGSSHSYWGGSQQAAPHYEVSTEARAYEMDANQRR